MKFYNMLNGHVELLVVRDHFEVFEISFNSVSLTAHILKLFAAANVVSGSICYALRKLCYASVFMLRLEYFIISNTEDTFALTVKTNCVVNIVIMLSIFQPAYLHTCLYTFDQDVGPPGITLLICYVMLCAAVILVLMHTIKSACDMHNM
uniref:Uncharacterized protein n=1 Tax=Glossina pallidipes TaxID=7398 RepID=A0A1A9Z8L8_GLOPL